VLDERNTLEQHALHVLARAHQNALGVGVDKWQFAVEVAEFYAAGLSSSDLRQLVCRGEIAHGRELTSARDPQRIFALGNSLQFSDQTCFVITEAGLARLAGRAARGETPPRAGKWCTSPVCPAVPRWDRKQHTLYWAGAPIKCFTGQAASQERLLQLFEADGWQATVAIVGRHELAGMTKQQVRDGVQNLRHSTMPYLFFGQLRAGTCLRWEARAFPSGHRSPTEAVPKNCS